jgi:hypothetical protein
MKTTFFLKAAAAAAGLFVAGAAHAATDVFTFSDTADGIFATGTLQVDNAPTGAGTYDITGVTGSVMNGSLASPTVDPIVGVIGNTNSPNATVDFGFQYDNQLPLNTNGVLFQGASGAIYNLWSNGGSAGELYTYGLPGVPNFDAHGVVSVSAGVPEPSSWAIMLMGFGALGAAVRGRRKLATA